MGGLFGPRGKISGQKPPPPARPDVSEETPETTRRGRPRARKETYLTGDLVPETKKKKVLG